MLVLVTQADGSARRIPFVSYGLVIAIAVSFFALRPAPNVVADLEASQTAALEFFNEHPYADVAPQFESVIPLDYARTLQQDYFNERRQMGLPLISERTVRRAQETLDALLDATRAKARGLPIWQYGVTADSPPANLLAHVGIHETRTVLMLALVFLLCTAIPLEDGWGTIFFGLFAAATVVLCAKVSVAVHYSDQTGLPWVGANGLVAACLGATLIRSLSGARLFGTFPMPGWFLLPLWLGLELVGVRKMISAETYMPAPVTVYGVAAAFGLITSAVVMALGLERRSIERAAASEELVSNPVLEKAMQARDKEDYDLAFDLLRRELRGDPENRDIAMALWDVALEMGKAPTAMDAFWVVVRSDLKSGNGDSAARMWINASPLLPEVDIDPSMGVRLAEAVLDAGAADEAVALLGQVVGGSRAVPTAAAQRIVRIARDLDPDLTRRAATIVLEDPRLSAGERQDLVALSEQEVTVEPSPSQAAPAVAAPSAPPAASPRAAPSESLEIDEPIEATVVGEGDLDLPDLPDLPDLDAPDLDLAAPPAQQSAWDDDAAMDLAMDLDPQALSIESLEGESSESGEPQPPVEDWNMPGVIDDVSEELSDDFSDFSLSEIEAAAADAGLLDDLTEELSPAGPSPGDRVEQAPDDTLDAATRVDLSRDRGDTTAVVGTVALRRLRTRVASPLELEAAALTLDVEGTGKTRLPFDRIQAVSAGAVKGLADKPVLLVDLALNWRSSGESLKLIRLRSDDFDPMRIVPDAESPIDALRKLLTELVRASGATPLPSFNGATGAPFAMYESLEVYQRDVLMAEEAELSAG